MKKIIYAVKGLLMLLVLPVVTINLQADSKKETQRKNQERFRKERLISRKETVEKQFIQPLLSDLKKGKITFQGFANKLEALRKNKRAAFTIPPHLLPIIPYSERRIYTVNIPEWIEKARQVAREVAKKRLEKEAKEAAINN